MPEARVQLAVTVETEGAEQLTTLRRELEQLGQSGTAAVARLDTSLTSVLSNLEQSRSLVATSTREFLANHRQLIAGLEPLFQGFLQRLLAGTRNFRDLLKRLFADLLNFFLRTVEQMVAAWLTGVRQMSGAGGGGFLGALFGGFGGGGGLLSLAAPLISSGLGFRLGPGGTAPTFPTAGGGGISATNLGLLSQLGIPLHDLSIAGLAIPGGVLASGGLLGVIGGYQTGSRALGALGGAALGFALGGPIGAAIGAVAGFFAGVLGRGKKKRQASRIAEEGFAEMRRIIEQFKKFEVDFESALGALNAIWEQMQSGWRQLGKSIFNRSVRGEQPEFNTIVNELKQIQQAREARGKLIEGLPIPEFQLGGLVRAIHAREGRILAFLHEGEAVLNRRAVQALGPQFIERANRAPAFQAGGFAGHPLSPAAPAAGGQVSITVNIQAAPGMDEHALADFTIRKLKRELEDRGLSLGG
ncbi:MAG TPA: hypothetical protein VJ085_04380 [Candidatus Acidoferrales bacterium]|nr:hypothetical protein [Candidatus Acidoferrales bacterium]